MTDKVQKISEEVERLKSQLLRGACSSQIAMETRCKEEAYDEVLSILDSLQEEPVSRIWHDASEKPERDDLLIETNDGRIIHRQSINNYGMVKRWAYTSDLLNLDNSCNFGKNLQEEHVSEDLEAEIKRYVYDPYFNLNGVAVKGATEYLTVEDVADIARHFANWQKQQMMAKTIDGKVLINGMGNPILHLWDKGKHLIDKKVKVIVIKED